MQVFRDGTIDPPKGVDLLSYNERISYCLAVISSLSGFVGDDALHSALQCCLHVRIPRFNTQPELWTE